MALTLNNNKTKSFVSDMSVPADPRAQASARALLNSKIFPKTLSYSFLRGDQDFDVKTSW